VEGTRIVTRHVYFVMKECGVLYHAPVHSCSNPANSPRFFKWYEF